MKTELIIPGETVYQCVSRHGVSCGAAQYMDSETMCDTRPATLELLVAASARLRGYGGALVRHVLTGEMPGCDAATERSVQSILRRA